MVALAWVGAAEVSSLRGAVCARAECAQTTEDRQWRVVRGQSTEGRAAGSRHATRVRAARCALLNSVSSVPQCGQTGRGPFLIRSMPPARANGRGNGQRRPARFVGRAAPRGSLAGRRVRHTRRPGTLALRVANGGRGPGPTRNGGAAGALRGPVAGRDSGRRGGRSRSRVERSREGRWWSDARTVRSSTRAAAKRGKLITVSEWRAPPTGPRPDRSACPDGSSTAPPPAHAREARARESRRVGCRALAAAGVVRFKSIRFEPRSRTWTDSSFTRSARTVAQCRECARYRIDVSASTISGHSHSLCTVSSCRASVGEDVGARNRRPCRPVQERWSHCAR